jgi:hypothetical protein
MKVLLSRHRWTVLLAVLVAIALLLVSFASAASQVTAADASVEVAQAQTWPPPPSTQPASPSAPRAPTTAARPAAPAAPAGPAGPAKGADIRLPPTTAQAPPGSSGFSDAFGRFNLALPSGSEPLNATYNLAVPASNLQINLSVAPRDEIFRNSLQSFPDMMRNNGALNVGQQQFDYRGRQATMVVVRLRDPQGATIESVNVFIPGANLWLQVNGPESDGKLVEDTMQSLLRNLQLR